MRGGGEAPSPPPVHGGPSFQGWLKSPGAAASSDPRRGQYEQIWAGAAAEITAAPTPLLKLRKAFSLACIIGSELKGLALLLPYGLRAWRTWRGLPPYPPRSSKGVTIHRAVRYGDRPRNL